MLCVIFVSTLLGVHGFKKDVNEEAQKNWHNFRIGLQNSTVRIN